MAGLPLVTGEEWSRGDFNHRVSQKKIFFSNHTPVGGNLECIWPCKCKVVQSMEVPWKLIQMAMSRGIHFRRVGEFRSTAMASALKNASWAEIPLLSSQVTEHSMPNDELRVRNVSEPQGFPSIRVSKSASKDSSWLEVAQWWLWWIDAGYSACCDAISMLSPSLTLNVGILFAFTGYRGVVASGSTPQPSMTFETPLNIPPMIEK